MRRLTFILAGVLAVQLALAAGLWFGGSDYASFKAKDPLLAFDPRAVERIEIDESGANTVTLAASNGSWVVPPMADFPADGGKVTALLAKLADLKKGWPVATSGEAAQRFKVAEETHERRIVLRSGDKTLGVFLFGTSPSFRQVHARASGDDKIYNVTFATYDAGTRGEDWMNRDLLSIGNDKIASIAVGDVTLDRKDGKYQVAGLGEGEQQKESEVWKLVGSVTAPTFDAVQGKGPEALAKVEQPDIQVSVKQTDGTTVLLKYKKDPAGGAYFFASSAREYLFRVDEGRIQPIIKAKRETLVEAKKSEADKGQAIKQPEAPAEQSGG